MKISRDWPLENHSMRVDERQVAALPQKRDRRSLAELHLNRVRQRAANRGVFDPRNRFELAPPLIDGNAKDAFSTVGGENFQHRCARDVVQRLAIAAGNDDLLGVDQRHFRRRNEEVCGVEGDPNAGDAGATPKRDPKIRLPCAAAELAPLDFQRFLPTKILRLLVRQDLLRVRVDLDGPQFRQTITSFSSSMP
jgi:hypothetical protein